MSTPEPRARPQVPGGSSGRRGAPRSCCRTWGTSVIRRRLPCPRLNCKRAKVTARRRGRDLLARYEHGTSAARGGRRVGAAKRGRMAYPSRAIPPAVGGRCGNLSVDSRKLVPPGCAGMRADPPAPAQQTCSRGWVAPLRLFRVRARATETGRIVRRPGGWVGVVAPFYYACARVRGREELGVARIAPGKAPVRTPTGGVGTPRVRGMSGRVLSGRSWTASIASVSISTRWSLDTRLPLIGHKLGEPERSRVPPQKARRLLPERARLLLEVRRPDVR
jgi:hypothetical protein